MRRFLAPVLASSTLVATLAVTVLGLAVTASPASADDTTILLATAAPGQTLDDPAVLTSAAGTGVAVWTQQATVGDHVVRTPQVRRQSGSGGWTPVALPIGALDVFSAPFLTQDPVTGRILLTANANSPADLGSTLGTYLWWSADEGASYHGPVKVWNDVGVGDAAPDGAGGFYTTVNQTGAYLAHVPSTYAMQSSPGSQIQLTDRFGSRGAIGLATGGPGSVPVLGFLSGSDGLWAHHSTTFGQTLDTPLFPTGDGLHIGVAGNASGVLTAGLRQGTSADTNLYSRTVDPVTGVAGAERQISFGGAAFFGLRAQPGSGELAAVWTDAADGVFTTRTEGGTSGSWRKTSQVQTRKGSGVSHLGQPDVSSGWVVGLGNKTGDNTAVVWATRNAAVTEKPEIDDNRISFYQPRTRTVSLSLYAGAPGKVKVAVVVTGIATKPVTAKSSFRVEERGKFRQNVKVSKKLASRLAGHPRAKITVRLTITNVAGSDSTTIKVPRVRGRQESEIRPARPTHLDRPTQGG